MGRRENTWTGSLEWRFNKKDVTRVEPRKVMLQLRAETERQKQKTQADLRQVWLWVWPKQSRLAGA